MVQTPSTPPGDPDQDPAAAELERHASKEAAGSGSPAVARRFPARRDEGGSDGYYRSLIENASDIIALVNAGGTLRYASPSIERVLGYRAEQLVGKSAFELIHPDDAPRVMDLFTHQARGRACRASIEFRVRHHDGSWRYIESLSKNLLDDPAVSGLVVSSRDVTERRRAEEDRVRLTAVIEATTDFVATLDARGRTLYINGAGRRMLDLSEDEDATSLHLPDLHPRWATELILREGIPTAVEAGVWTGETALLGQDGRVVPVSQVMIAHKTPDGTLKFLSTIARDITERKRSEEALRRSEERFRSLIEKALDLITILDPEGIIQYESPSIERVLGYGPEELLGVSVFELVHPEDRPGVVGALAELAETPGSTALVEFRVRHRDGSWRLLEATGRNLLHDPAVAAIVVNSRDVTERKRAEEALRRSEEQLRQAQKMEAVGRLAGGIAHDFNNLLTAIRGHTQLLLEDVDAADPKRDDLEEVGRAADRAAALTRQLLAFSRKQVLQPKVLDLNGIVREMGAMFRRIIGEDVELTTVAGPALGRVRADPNQIEQVLLNLVVNARDAMPAGGKLLIETRNVDLDDGYVRGHVSVQGGHYVLLAVSDTGCGIPMEIQEQIFEPFFTTKEVGKGTGLGLSTVYGIVKQSGGYIWVYSEVGQGTTFKIYLPRVHEEVEAIPSPVAAGAVRSGAETVLVVEDEEAVRALVRKVLEKSGYTLLLARDGAEALERSAAFPGPIHLLVTDVVMPGMSGPELVQRLLVERPEMRVLYMSGYTEDAIVNHGMLQAGSAFLEKPFAPSALARRVRDVLDASRS